MERILEGALHQEMAIYKNACVLNTSIQLSGIFALERIFQLLRFFLVRCVRQEPIRHIKLLKTEKQDAQPLK